MATSGAAGTVVYDGECGFCTRCATWLRSHLDATAGNRVTVVPWQGADLDELGLSVRDVLGAAWWVHDGQRLRGAAAVTRALRACHRPWPLLGAVLACAPVRPLARGAYAVVARHRGRIGHWIH